MTLTRCKCGRNTDNGFLCVSCQKDSTIDMSYYDPKAVDEEELEGYGFTIVEFFDDDEDDDD